MVYSLPTYVFIFIDLLILVCFSVRLLNTNDFDCYIKDDEDHEMEILR